MFQILVKDFDADDYEVIDFCSDEDLEDTKLHWQQMFDFVIVERC